MAEESLETVMTLINDILQGTSSTESLANATSMSSESFNMLVDDDDDDNDDDDDKDDDDDDDNFMDTLSESCASRKR
ncbi:hypothetical protein TYRP_016213 [Tyrophagus putrescentiae]|nr:hypothetical protein TYRP_016213 [Tyrophagus putrescentiae]